MQTPPGEQPTVPGGAQQGADPSQPPAQSYPPHPQHPQQPPPPYPGPYGQPPYASSPYGQPYPPYAPYAQPYGYGPPPQAPQPRASNKGLWIGLSILGVVILLSCIGCAVGFGLLINNTTRAFTSSFGPDLVATELCNDEEVSDYTAVYDLFSSDLQSQTTQDAFVAASQAREQSNGVVQNCVPQSPSQPQSASARVHITLTLNDGPHSGYITLVQQGGLWQIDSYDSSLGLT